MKLSMWMIANRLESFDMIQQIDPDAKAVLKSARQVYADNCAVVAERGPNIICYDAYDINNRILFKNMSTTQGLELVQGVFDFYQDWIDEMKRQLAVYNYQKVVDLCWMVFHNPIILFSGNNRVLAMSGKYEDEEMDNEWRYLHKYGYPSIANVRENRKRDSLNDVEGTTAGVQNKDKRFPSISSPIRFRDKIYGRVVLLEKDRKLNPGDHQLLTVLINELRLPLAEQRDAVEDGGAETNSDCLGSLLEGRATHLESLSYLLEMKGWRSDDDFRVYRIRVTGSGDQRSVQGRILADTLKRNISSCAVIRREDGDLYLVQTVQHEPSESAGNKLKRLAEYNDFLFSVSLEMRGILNLCFLRKQADYTMKRAEKRYAASEKREQCEYDFYDDAVDYLIMSGDLGNSLYAVHPEILRLWLSKQKSQDDKFDTYLCYLENGKSLKRAAEQLHLHRNTVVYRINKIHELLKCETDDIYTMDYIRLSIRVLALIEEKKIITSQNIPI